MWKGKRFLSLYGVFHWYRDDIVGESRSEDN